ncbi:hypothetical protein ACFX2I_040543 [Malus domestica]
MLFRLCLIVELRAMGTLILWHLQCLLNILRPIICSFNKPQFVSSNATVSNEYERSANIVLPTTSPCSSPPP